MILHRVKIGTVLSNMAAAGLSITFLCNFNLRLKALKFAKFCLKVFEALIYFAPV